MYVFFDNNKRCILKTRSLRALKSKVQELKLTGDIYEKFPTCKMFLHSVISGIII